MWKRMVVRVGVKQFDAHPRKGVRRTIPRWGSAWGADLGLSVYPTPTLLEKQYTCVNSSHQ